VFLSWRSSFALILLCAAVAPAQRRSADGPLFPPWPAIWSSYDTRPKDCHRAIVDKQGRLVLVGVETTGDPRTVEARQAVTMLVNEKGFWSAPIRISEPGIVYFSAFTVDTAGKVWIAWSEFKGNVWHIMARTWDRGKLGVPVQVSSEAAVNLQPAIAALPSGEVYVAWQAAADRFQIRGRAWRDGRWQSPEILALGSEQSFRPVLAVDSHDALWLAWDRAGASRYQTVAKVRDGGKWSKEIAPFGDQPTRVPEMHADGSGRVWIMASGKLAGVDSAGQRYQLTAGLGKFEGAAQSFAIDPKGRFWLFRALGQRGLFDWMPAVRNAAMQMAVVDSEGVHELEQIEALLGYDAPLVDAAGNVWAMNSVQFLRFRTPYPKAASEAAVKTAAPQGPAATPEKTREWPRYEVGVNGRTAKVWWAEMHNHLLELPLDRNIATWVDRLYLTTRYRDGLDALALTDHDWPGMTRSMYYVEQGIASVLNAPGRFAAFAGYEWSGDSQVRGRFGDRTVLFPTGYHDIPRITDDSYDTSDKLAVSVRKLGGLDWPHHIGRAESPVNPKYLNPDTEPVMEMTSGHGVFETYDPAHMVKVPYHTQIVPGTSVQDALAMGKRVGMVGSSDSHSGFSGFPVGMLAIVAPELTNASLLAAIKQRRAYAIRGGQPILLDFRVDDHFMGDIYSSAKPPRIRLKARGTKPIVRIELVRNNRYIFTKDYTDAAPERNFEYQDEEMPPAFYYVRVTQAEGEWAWSSPVWVDR
jgi:hypothetical protein